MFELITYKSMRNPDCFAFCVQTKHAVGTYTIPHSYCIYVGGASANLLYRVRLGVNR
jgi:hypothetical protein